MSGPHYYDVPKGYAEACYTDAPVPRQPSDWERFAGDLDQMTAQAEQMTAEMAGIANRLFGPPPPAVTGQAKEPHGVGALDELHARHEALRSQLAALWQQCERFRRLA